MGISHHQAARIGEGMAEAEIVEWHVKVGDVGARGPDRSPP